MDWIRGTAVVGIAVALTACASIHNLPLNKPSATPLAGTMAQLSAAAARGQPSRKDNDGVVIGLAFSGGGTRAAAFAYGVLEELARTPSGDGKRRDLLDHVGIVSGVSGGAIMAAYYGLNGRAALDDFREQFLAQDLMAELDTSVSLVSVGRALGGGVNTDNRLRDWFNAHLFHGATFKSLIGRRPIVLINATDVYSRTPFPFAPTTFAAMCSDIADYPVAAAVAASAAVPGVFAPVVIEPFPGQCQTPLPERVVKAAHEPGKSPLVYAFAKSLERARTGKVKYIKLFDGGLVDNYGLSGITIARASVGTPYGPLRPEEAVNLRRLMFLVVDAGRGPQGDWSQTLEGPSGKDLVGAVMDTVIDANTRSSYAAFEATLRNWRDDLVRWRCGLPHDEVRRLRGGGGRWNCRDVKFTVARVSFEQLDAARAKLLNEVPTSFTLPARQIDEVTRAGADALKANPTFQAFKRDM
jgi:predicted acylesterase/phospholipase RssA